MSDAGRDLDLHLVAMGAYLRARRLACGLTQTQAAAAAHMSVAQIQRIEAGLIDTGGSGLLLLMHAVGASFDDALMILTHPAPTAEMGRELGETPRAPISADRLATLAAEIARDAGRDPDLITALAGFLAGRRSRYW